MSHNFYNKQTILASLLLTLASTAPIHSSQAKARVDDTPSSWLSRTWTSLTTSASELHYLGIKCRREGKLKKAFEYFQDAVTKATEINKRMYLLDLAACYETGIGIEKNPEMAFECYKQAGDLTEALQKISFCYEFGEGTQKDVVKAFECYVKLNDIIEGMEKYYPFAIDAKEKAEFSRILFAFSLFYTNGKGVEKDTQKGDALRKLASRYSQEANTQQG